MKLEVFMIDGKPVTLPQAEYGIYQITKEQLDKLLDAAYEAGKKATHSTYTPYYPGITCPGSDNTDPYKKDWGITWGCSSDGIPCNCMCKPYATSSLGTTKETK